MITLKFAAWVAVFVTVFQGIVIFALKTFIERFIQHRFDAALASQTHLFEKALEEYKLGLKIREQASAIAEYSVIAETLTGHSPAASYEKANKMARELFLWLPTDAYRNLGQGLAGDRENLVKAFITVRSILLGNDAGDLGPNDIIVHAPGIGLRS